MSRKPVDFLGPDRDDLRRLAARLRAGDDSVLEQIFDDDFRERQFRATATRVHRHYLDLVWPDVRAAVGRFLRQQEPPAQFNMRFNEVFRRVAIDAARIPAAVGRDPGEVAADRARMHHVAGRLGGEFDAGAAGAGRLRPAVPGRGGAGVSTGPLTRREREGTQTPTSRAVRDYVLSLYLEAWIPPAPRHLPPLIKTTLSRAGATIDARKPEAKDKPPLEEPVRRMMTTARLIIAAQSSDGEPFCRVLTTMVTGKETPLTAPLWKAVRAHADGPCKACRRQQRRWADTAPLDKLSFAQRMRIWQAVGDQESLSAAAAPGVSTPSAGAGPAAAAVPPAAGVADAARLGIARRALGTLVRPKVLVSTAVGGLITGAMAWGVYSQPSSAAADVPRPQQETLAGSRTSPATSTPTASGSSAPSAAGASPGQQGYTAPPAGAAPTAAADSTPGRLPSAGAAGPGPARTGGTPPEGVTGSAPQDNPAPRHEPKPTGSTPTTPVDPAPVGPPNMAGPWRLQFTRTNFGGPVGDSAQGRMQPYTITLRPASDKQCVYTTPCWIGDWKNPGAGNRTEGTAVFSISSDGTQWRLQDKEGSDTQADYTGSYAQYYDGRADKDPSKPLVFTGTWSQVSPTDTTITTPGSHTRTATFILSR